jgi:sulfide:quinone oxidoreductase
MERPFGSDRPAHVVIAGGGFAGVEALLALRALAGDRVQLTLVSPESWFAYRPAATLEAFDRREPRCWELQAVAEDLGATFYRARLESVGGDAHYVRLSSGSRLAYDALVIALGARPVATIAGALTFRDQRDVPLFRRLLAEVTAGSIRQLVFASPPGCSWPVPLYELALLSADHAAKCRRELQVAIVSPEHAPLDVFGSEPARLVAELLAQRRIRFVGDAAAQAVQRDGSLALQSGERIEADRVVAAPQLRGRWITGVPANWWGFVPVDRIGRVEGLADVYAAGDVTTYPVKHGTIATQQADVIARAIAADCGVELAHPRLRRVLQARLIGGSRPLCLRAEVDHAGHATTATLVRAAAGVRDVEDKVFARYLTPYFELATAVTA